MTIPDFTAVVGASRWVAQGSRTIALSNTNAFLPTYPGADGHVQYADDLLMGYRGYDRAGTDPRFCFGHGLGYTSYEYDDLTVAGRRVTEAVLRLVDLNDWTRRNFVRWMFEDEPRAIVLTPSRWHRRFLRRVGAYVGH